MTPDDPFFDDVDPERTIIRPMPGRQGGQQQEPRQIPAESPPAAPATPEPVAPRQVGGGAISSPGAFESMLGRSINPMVGAASATLVMANQLKNTTSHGDVAGLRSFAVQLIKKFESAANHAGYSRETVLTARYVLCVFVDEAVLGTPWGSESQWRSESLLSTFHNDVWGGEKFFVLLDRLNQQAASHIDLLELFYVCLALGFRGKYGVAQMGLSQLSDIQGNLYRTIVNQRADFERELSPRWAGVPDRRNVLERYVPLWVVGALAGVMLLVLFSGFRVILHNTSNPLIDQLDAVGRETAVVSEPEEGQ